MAHTIHVIGIGADGPASLSARARQALVSATWIAGGRRHLALCANLPVETFAITNNIPALVERLQARAKGERCVVLASGDPLFYGIGKALIEALGHEQVVVEPAVSSLQLAFARAGVAWESAAIGSIHGRPFAESLMPLLGRPVIGLFTQDGASPSEVAWFFLERGLEDYDAWVCESLGADNECVTALPLGELADRPCGDLNVLVLKRQPQPPQPASKDAYPFAGLPDALFAQPEAGPVLLTHADVRAVTLARFRDLPAGPIWDLGAGLGGVAIELARAFPGREIVAIERNEVQRSYLQINRQRLGAYNVRIVAGEAPETLAGESAPAAVFLGGSGGRLDEILSLIFEQLRPGGCLVANFVVLENLARCLERLRHAGWQYEVAQLQLAYGQPLGVMSALAPLRPVWIVRAGRP